MDEDKSMNDAKKIWFLFVLSFSLGFSALESRKKSAAEPWVVAPPKGQYSVLKTLVLCSPSLTRLAKIVKDDLDFTDQFAVTVNKTDQDLEKIKAEPLFKQGYSLLVSLKTDAAHNVDVTVKDTSSNMMVLKKTVVLEQKKMVPQGHALSGEILEKMTGDRGVCSTSIAYCKMISPHHKVICLSDYACKRRKVIVSSKAVNLAPSWHTTQPVLFYSQLTRSNNRLMSVDLRTGTHKVVCSYAGLNMQPSFSKDGKKAIICLSGGRGNSELYLYDPRLCRRAGKRVFRGLTRNGGHNVSPCMLPDGNVIFCSDYQTGMPQIYHLNLTERSIQRLTGGKGYCAAPAYCAKTNMLVYTRPVKGIFQLFTLSLDDLNAIQERQITVCGGNKHEPSWSACGRYIVFSLDRQIAALNHKSGRVRVLTRGPAAKSFPRWTAQAV